MKKIYSFILSSLLGIISVFMIPAFIIKSSLLISSYPSDELVFSSPIIFCVLTVCYFIWKKKGCIPIAGVILGFVFGYFLLLLGLGMGNT